MGSKYLAVHCVTKIGHFPTGMKRRPGESALVAFAALHHHHEGVETGLYLWN